MLIEEFNKIEPGLKLDALIAEKVMGFNAYCFIDDVGRLRDAECEVVPLYSTSITAAWEVVEKLKDELPQGIKISFWKHEGWCVAWKFDNMGALDDGFILASTAPLAICRAALKATLE